jgi:hypothetical protein
VAGGSARSRAAVHLLGVAEGDAYWVEESGPHSGATTCVRRAPVDGGEVETVVSEEGRQGAAIVDSMLVWTSHSMEAAQPRLKRAVKRASLDGTGAEVVADWLGADGHLLASRSGIYFQEKSRLWGLRGGRGEQRVLYERPHGIVAASAIGDEEYLATRLPGGVEVATRPLTWAARLRAMASP